jgi:hypothetical protein
MAARDRMEFNIKCPSCGNAGLAECSEGDHPYMKSPEFSVDSLPDGFQVKEYSNVRQETVLKCKCGHKAKFDEMR